jgi:hypothetical protein
MTVRAVALGLILTAAASPLIGQERPPDRFRNSTVPEPTAAMAPTGALQDPVVEAPQPAHPVLLGLGGTVGAVVGALTGFGLGYSATTTAGLGRGEDPGLRSALTGYLLGAGAGAALGAHLANRGQGELGISGIAAVSASLSATLGVYLVSTTGTEVNLAVVAAAGPTASAVVAAVVEGITTGN